MAILSTFVRLGILIWAGGILTLNYVTFPGMTEQDKIDPTFIASVFTGVLATFGVEAGKNKGKSASSGGGANISKERYGDAYRESNSSSTCTDNKIGASTNGYCTRYNTK